MSTSLISLPFHHLISLRYSLIYGVLYTCPQIRPVISGCETCIIIRHRQITLQSYPMCYFICSYPFRLLGLYAGSYSLNVFFRKYIRRHKKGPGCQTIFRRFQGYQCFPAIPSAADFYFIVL